MPDEEMIPALPGRSYVDTSALAKWYLNEEQLDRVEEYLQSLPVAGISSLTVVEMRCLLARRRRYAEITQEQELHCYALFRQDIQEGHLQVDGPGHGKRGRGSRDEGSGLLHGRSYKLRGRGGKFRQGPAFLPAEET